VNVTLLGRFVPAECVGFLLVAELSRESQTAQKSAEEIALVWAFYSQLLI
jgi:hypothetical protein